MPLNHSLTFAFRDVTILGRARFWLRIRLMIHESSYLDSTLLVNPSLRQPIGCLIQVAGRHRRLGKNLFKPWLRFWARFWLQIRIFAFFEILTIPDPAPDVLLRQRIRFGLRIRIFSDFEILTIPIPDATPDVLPRQWIRIQIFTNF